MTLGERCRIEQGVRLETGGNGRLQIGNDVVLTQGVVLVAHMDVQIGDGAMIGEYASVRDQNHVIDGVTRVRDSGFRCAPVSVGTNVWIGRGAVVLPGATLEDGAVVGANSVVKGRVPAGEIWAGVPARFIRRREGWPTTVA